VAPVEKVDVAPMLRAPELDKGLQVRSHQSGLAESPSSRGMSCVSSTSSHRYPSMSSFSSTYTPKAFSAGLLSIA